MLTKIKSFFPNIVLKFIETFLPTFNYGASTHAPTTGHRIMANGHIEIVAIEELKINDILRVLPGEPIPMDGEIVKGHTFVDKKAASDAALPTCRNVGDHVTRGTINCYHTIEIRVTRLAADSSLPQSSIEKAEYC